MHNQFQLHFEQKHSFISYIHNQCKCRTSQRRKRRTFLGSLIFIILFRLAIVDKHYYYSTGHLLVFNGNVISFLSIMKIDLKKISNSSFRRSNSCQTFQIWYCFCRYVFTIIWGLQKKKIETIVCNYGLRKYINIFQRHNID